MRTIRQYWIIHSIFIMLTHVQGLATSDSEGPSFILEPDSQVRFYNTSGVVIPCSATGNPIPILYWTDGLGNRLEDIPGLRYVRSDGSLIFSSFSVDKYQQPVHSTLYWCVASNRVGTIRSRDVHVRAVIYQVFEAQVYNGNVIRGNTGILRCHIPNYLRDYVTVTSWARDDGQVIFPLRSYDPDSKYVLFSSGELHIRNAQKSDSDKNYKCHVTDRLTHRSISSATSGRLIVREPETSQAPRFVHFLKNIQTKEKSTVHLSCLAQGYPTPRYAWYFSKDGRMTVVYSDKRIVQLDGSLIIQRVTIRDAGTYFCMVSNDVGQERGEIRLDVIVALKVAVHPIYQKVNSGNPAVINCSAQGYPIHSVSWWKDKRPLKADGRIMFPSPESLYIHPTRREDGGMYQCIVKNNEESVQGTARLIISAQPPRLKSHFSSMVVDPGSQVSLSCKAVGNPLPQVTWSTYHEPIQDSNRIRVGDYVSRDGAVISFVNFTRIEAIDGGVYQCTATNNNGIENHQAQVSVFGPPVIRQMKNKTVVGGNTVMINCPVGGYPIKQITWEKDTRELPLGRRHRLFPNGTLMISNIGRLEDQGNYLCKAEGKDGTIAKQEFYLKVLVPPVITPFSFPDAPREGIRASVTCIVQEGDPPIELTWLKNGAALEADGNLSVEHTNMFMSSLVFEKLKPEYSAKYTCVASNEATAVNHSASLIVNSPPRWKIEPKDTSVVIGNSVILHCQAEGKPEPRMIWKKSTGQLSVQYNTIISGARIQTLVNGSLVIHQVAKEDQGKYMCEASNGVGSSISAIFEIKVHTPPNFHVKFSSLAVKEGSDVSLTCDSHGDRPILFTWFKNHQQIQIERQQRFVLDTTSSGEITKSELTIFSANRADSGNYRCEAKNIWGSDDRSLQLQVLGIPDSPRKIQMKKTEARSVTLAWSEPFDGNRPIRKYIVHYRKENGIENQMEELVLESDQKEVAIRDLQPMTRYHFILFAENDLGRSQPSEVLSTTTEEEAPKDPPRNVEAVATSSHSLRMSWKNSALEDEQQRIKGYYIGYRLYGSDDSFIYKTVGQENNKEELDGLLPGRTYEVVVQAFNAKGAGPMSKEVLAQTFEFDPPNAVIATVMSTTSSSVQLQWTRARHDTQPVTGYVIHYRSQGETAWFESQVSGDKNTYSVTDLQCGKTYQFYVTAFNTMGKGAPSDTVSTTTEGTAPVAPSQYDLISFNSTTITFNLDSWRDGGCPIQYFQLQYKIQGQREWTVIGTKLYPEQQIVAITDLKPGTWYSVLMSAVNSVSVVEKEYRVATLTLSGATVVPPGDSSPRSRYRSLYIIVPVCCAAVVLIATTLAVFFVVCRRRTSTSSNVYEGRRSLEDTKGDIIAMADLEKQYGDTSESAYFPSPYATTRVPVFPREIMPREGAPGSRSLVRSSTRGHENNYDVPQPRRTRCKALLDQTSEPREGSGVSSDCESITNHLDGYEQPRKSIRPKIQDHCIYPNSFFEGSTSSYEVRSDYTHDYIYSPVHVVSSSVVHDSLEPSDTECDRDLTVNKGLGKCSIVRTF
ncbi:cell adhesion molecule Dscam1-like isoform X3 [Tachypleus tridentatus]|uniref:cell adhesion molecule Dscam1-like isoform X3 n=2 Tax=Tachypleus tridentatus TaxID=6853 RepID=UPI003FD50161